MIANRIGRLAAVVLTMVTMGCSSPTRVAKDAEPSPRLPTGTVRIQTDDGIVELQVRIAETAEARRLGLMGVRHLDRDAGMAFLFSEPVDPGFWMKDTLIPLAIAFWDSDGRIADIQEMTPCQRDPCPLYSPGVRVMGALEANRGFFAAHGVRPGDPIDLIRQTPGNVS
jgi:uncharacterized membrane protein (UPF0127 family)